MATGSAGCVNLKERFGDRYRVGYEESYYAERSRHTVVDPCLMIIPCQHGHIFPWGGDLLAVSTHKRGGVSRMIRRLPFVHVKQDGEDGINATFPVDHFDEVAEIMKPRRRRQLSPEQREAMTRRLAKFRFQAAGQAPKTDVERTQGVQATSDHQTDSVA